MTNFFFPQGLMNRTVYIFIPGILTEVGDMLGWAKDACRYIQVYTPHCCDRFDYFTLPLISRRLFQSKRVKCVVEMIRQWNEFRIVLVGHSNGCDIICRILKQYPIRIHQVHLIAGATDCSCNANGINEALRNGNLGSAHVYCSLNDDILRDLAKGWTGWLKPIGLGYGWIGYGGPTDIDNEVRDKIHVIRNDLQNHVSWMSNEFMENMERIVGAKHP